MALAANSTIEMALSSFMLNDARMSALIGTRFYPNIVPQNPTTPYGRYRRVDSPRESSHDGPSALAHPRFQMDWVGGAEALGFTGYGLAVETARAARFALQDFKGIMETIRIYRVELADERDFLDDDLKIVGRSQDFIIWHEEESPVWL